MPPTIPTSLPPVLDTTTPKPRDSFDTFRDGTVEKLIPERHGADLDEIDTQLHHDVLTRKMTPISATCSPDLRTSHTLSRTVKPPPRDPIVSTILTSEQSGPINEIVPTQQFGYHRERKRHVVSDIPTLRDIQCEDNVSCDVNLADIVRAESVQYDSSSDCSVSSVIDNECPLAGHIDFYNSAPPSLCPTDKLLDNIESEDSLSDNVMPTYNIATGNRYDILTSELDVTPSPHPPPPHTVVDDQRANQMFDIEAARESVMLEIRCCLDR